MSISYENILILPFVLRAHVIHISENDILWTTFYHNRNQQVIVSKITFFRVLKYFKYYKTSGVTTLTNILTQSVHDSFHAHDDVIKWTHFPRYWPFVRGIHRSPVNFPHKGQWRGALMFSLYCDWINGWVNNREAGDLKRHRAHYDVIVMP